MSKKGIIRRDNWADEKPTRGRKKNNVGGEGGNQKRYQGKTITLETKKKGKKRNKGKEKAEKKERGEFIC